MDAPDRVEFVARTLQSPAGLDGCFRVHVSQDHLDSIGIQVGQPCEITADQDGVTVLGYGIAWRALDKMGNAPKLKPARMTDVLRNAFGIKEGSHVFLGSTKRKVIVRADKVVLSDVTPKEFSMHSNSATTDDYKWLKRIDGLLADCEAFANGQTFEISSKARVKKRFCIEHVEATDAQQGIPSLYFIDDATQVVFGESYASRPSSAHNGHASTTITTERIGGLLDEIQKLNDEIERVLVESLEWEHDSNQGVLIHGYEGTGKSLLLKQVEHIRPLNTVRIDKAKLNKGPASKNRETVEALFAQAVGMQPSIVIMDDLDKVAPSTGEGYGDAIASELDKLEGKRVLVVATCRTPGHVKSELTDPGRLSRRIELPIPDASARASILSVILIKARDPTGSLAKDMSVRTHGFTGKDLKLLVEHAVRNAKIRRKRLEPLRSIGQNGSLENPTDGAIYSQAAASIEKSLQKPETASNGSVTELSIEDFDLALTEVRPTALREIFFEKPQVDWSSIGGSQIIKERFDEIIGLPRDAADQVAWYRMRSQKGVLLYGPPGCSKTLTAQAVANTYDLNFIAVKGAELISMYVGESERAVREIFRKARAAAPCVIFFDEIDSIASAREGNGTKGLNVLTTLLNEMDGFESLKGVLVLAATNKPDALDPAIMRPGRFDSHIYLGPPDDAARREIFAMHTKGICLEELDFAGLSHATEGYSGAEIVSMCNVAKQEALKRDLKNGQGVKGLVMADLRKGLESTRKGITAEMLAMYEGFANRDGV